MIYAAGTELALCKYGLEEEEGKEKKSFRIRRRKNMAGEGKRGRENF